MKLNLGCGNNTLDGYINVDMYATGGPDIVTDLEQTPWPFDTSSATEVLFNHSLEHMGRSSRVFLAMMQELYRVSAPGASIQINVPHPRHDNYLDDPTHVRPITPNLLTLFSKKQNQHWRQGCNANSPLALYLDIDFEVRKVTSVLEETYMQLLREQKLTDGQLQSFARERNNVIAEYRITLEVIK
jgi:hypothetical protein